MIVEIEFCPLCHQYCWAGSSYIRRTTKNKWRVECSEECGYNGPWRPSRIEAIKTHNERAPKIRALMEKE